MSDVADTFDALREISREKRASNREGSAQILRDRGIAFETKNDGAHLVVTHGKQVADLWPGTGKYRVRRKGQREVYRRGVFNLLRDLGVREDGAA